MKRIISKIALPLLILALTGCQGWLDVSPRSEVRAEDLFKSEEGFWEALTGIYIGMADRSAYGANLSWDGIEFMAWQHVNTTSTGTWYELQRNDYTARKSMTFTDAVWNKLYNVIAEANYLLWAIDEWGDVLSPGVRRTIKGEALAIRAYCHFDLMRLYAAGNLADDPDALDERCVPYVTKYSKSVTPQKSYRETLAMLTDDIDEAAALLDERALPEADRVFTGYSNMNYMAMLHLRARVGQWTGDPRTLEYAEDVIEILEMETSKWSIDTEGNSGGGGGDDGPVVNVIMSSELLFYLNVWDLKNYMQGAYNVHVGGVINEDMLINSREFVRDDLYRMGVEPDGVSTADYRWQRWYADFSDSEFGIDGRNSVKVQNLNSTASTSIVPLMRISEPYLIAAECLVGVDSPRAAGYVDLLREKRGNPPEYALPGTISDEDLLRVIRLEMRREFSQEGQLFFMYKRIGQERIPGSLAGDMTAEKYILPYPAVEEEFGHTQKD